MFGVDQRYLQRGVKGERGKGGKGGRGERGERGNCSILQVPFKECLPPPCPSMLLASLGVIRPVMFSLLLPNIRFTDLAQTYHNRVVRRFCLKTKFAKNKHYLGLIFGFVSTSTAATQRPLELIVNNGMLIKN